MARPRDPGRPDLRRALGGPPPRRDHDRGRPDRDPPRRRRRGRQRRLTARPPIAWRRAQDRAGLRCALCRGCTGASCGRPRRPGSGTRTASASRAMSPPGRRDPWRPPTCAGRLPHRKLDVDDEATGAAAGRSSRRAGWVTDARRDDAARRSSAGAARHDVGRSRCATPAPCASSGTGHVDDARSTCSPTPRSRLGPARHAGVHRARPDGLHDARRRRGRGRDRPALRDPGGSRPGHRPSLVAAALAAGGRERAWIVADDEGLARALYERLGFADRLARLLLHERPALILRPPAKSVAARA